MKHPTPLSIALASATLFVAGGAFALDNNRPAIDPAAFHSRLLKDDTPLPNGGQMQMSYASVVEKILPSVVTVFSSGGKPETPEMEDIPPQLRPYFFRFFGMPDEGNDEEGGQQPMNPRRRGAPRQMPRDDNHNERKGVGSGFIISADGYIVTNNHVVADADKIEVAVEVNGNAKTYTAKVIGADPLSDVALIKIDATGLPQAVIGDSSKLRVGDVVLAAGAPMELNRSVTQGIVSAMGRNGMGIVRNGKTAGYEDFIQTDASINPGNSGGPLADAQGRIIGINTAILSKSGMNAGIGFAIPINMALSVVEDLLDDGAVQRGFLGIAIQDLDAEKAAALGLDNQGGAIVTMVTANSPAEKAGMEVGDVVVAVGGQKIDGSAKLRLIVSGRKPGTKVPLEVLRDGKAVTLDALLESLPDDNLAKNGTQSTPRSGNKASPNVSEIVAGVTVQNLTPATRQRYDIPNDVSGVIVTQVAPDSRAASMGVEEGDVITQVNRKPVTAAAEAREMAKSSDKTVLLKVYRKGDTMLFMVGNS